MLYQQGDVILTTIDEIPKTAKEIKPGPRGYVLAEGEVTGHAHVLDALSTTQMFGEGDSLFLSVQVPQKLRHEEHKHINIPAGKFKVGKVREVDPFAEEIRAVQD